MSKKRKWWQRFLDALKRFFNPTPVDPVKPDPVKPDDPVIVPPDSFPSVTFTEVHKTRDREWNISFHGAGIVGEYDNKSRKNARLVKLGTKTDLIAKNWETLQAPTEGGGPTKYCAAEKGSNGAPVINYDGSVFIGRKPRHEISLCTGVINGRSVTFSSDQKKEARSDWEDSATGVRLGTLHLSGAVIAAVPYAMGLLCVLQGGERATIVTTTGAEFPLNAWCLVRSDLGRIFAGGNDGHVYELVSGEWGKQTTTPLGGCVMSIECDGPYLWAATSKGDLWCILMDGRAQRVREGDVDYGGNSWFGPKIKAREFSVKIPDGNSWRCVILRLEVVP